ncbi:MAG: hypothetical protein ABSD53_18545 [Terriglobales bacterium]
MTAPKLELFALNGGGAAGEEARALCAIPSRQASVRFQATEIWVG